MSEKLTPEERADADKVIGTIYFAGEPDYANALRFEIIKVRRDACEEARREERERWKAHFVERRLALKDAVEVVEALYQQLEHILLHFHAACEEARRAVNVALDSEPTDRPPTAPQGSGGSDEH